MKTLNELVEQTFDLQDKLNSVVNPNWKTAQYPWYRAAWVEAAELMDHVKYKWWKNVNDPIDQEQALLELVDIYHFLVSDLIVHNISPAAITSTYNRLKNIVVKDKEDQLLEIEYFVNSCTDSKMILPMDYCRMLVVLGFKLENVLKWYIGKNCLNIFRQANGYKDGSYVKIWDGKEDNVVLAEFVAPSETVDYDELYKFLTEQYSKVTK